MISQVKPGEHFPDLVHNGDLLPLGSMIAVGSRSGSTFEQVAPRTWVSPSGGDGMDAYYLNTAAFLYRTEGESVALPLESVDAFRWRMRDSALGCAERQGIGISPVIQMVEAFGCGTTRFTEGGIVSSNVDIQQLPVGTVLYAGHPDVPKLMTVYEKKANGVLARILGTRDRAAGVPLTIHTLPGWSAPAPEVPADDETLTRMALRVFRVGRTYQKNNSWCGTFNTCMTSIGLTHQLLATIGATTHGPGDTLDRDSTALMPEGTILWHPWRSGAAFAVYIRDDSARNLSKTRRLFGWNDDGAHTHGHMTVVQTPDEPMAWRIHGSMVPHLPDGVTVRVNGYDQVLNDAVRGHIVNYYDYQVRAWPVDAPTTEEVF
jgi:hypothetical protein